ncbi:helix-turn-helix domain-containing protein [Spirillospora sp. NPDC047279]|uniref:PucR family transcriptional regulator n=1 Tax=Spirillospora sp. NPDC047279 TaxID=3155478 RepID=UPI0033C3A03D
MDVPGRLIDLRLPVDGVPAKAAALRKYVPGIARDAVREIERELPEYARPHDPRYADVLGQTVEWVIGHFIDLMIDPDAPSDEILDFHRQIGVGEAKEGRSLETWQAAMRIGAGIAVQRLTAESERQSQGFTPAATGLVAQAVFVYLDQIAGAVAEGHAEASARAAGQVEGGRRRLLELLIGADPQLRSIKEQAADAGWPLPQTVAAVALVERGPATGRPVPPPDVLVGLHLDEPCLVLPDPEGPGRRRLLTAGLRGWVAAIGPTVELTEVAKSLSWARQALDLTRRGVIAASDLVVAEEHMPVMVLMRDRELVERVAARRLAPLQEARPVHRRRLAETLLAALECGFNATEVAARLQVHPQTIRYRMRQLEGLFGTDLADPAHRLELHMVVYAWLLADARAEPGAGG